MKLALLGFLAGLAVVGLMGCGVPKPESYLWNPSDTVGHAHYEYGYGAAHDIGHALLERRLTERLNAAELHLSQRLERIESKQDALMLRFGFRPEGGQ